MEETVQFDTLAFMDVVRRFGFEGVARLRQRIPELRELDG